MKQLLVVRHAKSSWEAADISDFNRPLNERGKKDAPAMAHRLLHRKINIDAFISSPAKRAKKTAELFAKEFSVDKNEIILVESLYHSSTDAFYNVIRNIDNKFSTVAIFSHNPGITDFANTLTDIRTDNIPTCGIFAVTVNIDTWKDFEEATKTLLLYDYPKLGS